MLTKPTDFEYNKVVSSNAVDYLSMLKINKLNILNLLDKCVFSER